ncbi:MAG TPA: Crp/Fnr family transcriptional regulator [Dehalococcoidia bacterium]|nr:Crp/Fnr family transcriptional regulator [Dehalococcoidia bacterium]
MSRFFGLRKKSRAGRGAILTDDPATKLGLLRAADLFQGLNEGQMAHVEKITVMSRCERGRLVYSPGETSEVLFLLKEGRVHMYRITPEGKRLITAVVEPGTLFGNMAFTGTTMAENFAEAQEDSILCVMSRHDLEMLIREYPSVALRLLDTLSTRMRELEARLEEGLLRDMRSRVAAALIRLQEHHGSEEIPTTHQELADSLGTYRETVSHTLGQLQEDGCVRLGRGRIEIRDASLLKALIDADVTVPERR